MPAQGYSWGMSELNTNINAGRNPGVCLSCGVILGFSFGYPRDLPGVCLGFV